MHTNQLGNRLLADPYPVQEIHGQVSTASACCQSHREYWRVRLCRLCGMDLVSELIQTELLPDSSLGEGVGHEREGLSGDDRQGKPTMQMIENASAKTHYP